MFSLESHHRGDSNEYTQQTIINIKMKITRNYPKYNNICSYGFFSLGTQERIRNSRGKRAISVRVTEGPSCSKHRTVSQELVKSSTTHKSKGSNIFC